MKKYCLTLDLKPDADLIGQYMAHHQQVWPEVLESIRASGIQKMEIFRVENRLMMLVEADDDFSFEKKGAMDAANEKVQEWETLMDTYQQRLPFARPDEKWVLMDSIFSFQ